MYGPSGNYMKLVLFSLESWCFPWLRLGKHQGSRGNKTNRFPLDHTLSVWYSPIFKTACVAKNIWKVTNTIASIWLWKYGRILNFVPGHILFLKSSQFSESMAQGKLFTSQNRWCPQTNIGPYFHTKWGLLFIYTKDFIR